MRVRITIEVDVGEPSQWQQGMSPGLRWLEDYDLLWQVKGHGNGGADEVITLVGEEVV
jgi:hypothetical protein